MKAKILKVGTITENGEVSGFVFDGKDCECAAFNITDDTVCGYTLDELREMAENKFGLN
jgi:hypothetical protein